ncbi:hypothetical protein, partial [Cognatiluteimonas telluris]|uniref:hypothetical protein n=1 Tax=Cognatiluteimonas telluris TaxID=1104775 RepID=UPI001A9C65C4
SLKGMGLTIHSSRTCFVPAKGGTEERATFCLHYACQLNSGVSLHGEKVVNPATIITGALLAQVLLGLLMFIAASIMRAHAPRTATFRGEPASGEYIWLILVLLLVSVTTLVFTHSLSGFWVGLFQNTHFAGLPDSTATLIVFLIDIVVTTLLVANTGGSVDSPFQPVFFLIPTLALLLFESSLRVVIYAALVGVSFTFLLVMEDSLPMTQRAGGKQAYGFVSLGALALAVLIGLLTRICPGGVC